MTLAHSYPSREAAVRAEIVQPLEDRGVFVTEHDVEPIALRTLIPSTDGGWQFMCAAPEFWALVRAFIPEYAEPAPCPLAWCTGSRYEHAHLDPAEHEHASADDALLPGELLTGCISQEGNLPPFYRLDIDPNTTNTLLTFTELRTLAAEFERTAARLRERAGQLEQLRGLSS